MLDSFEKNVEFHRNLSTIKHEQSQFMLENDFSLNLITHDTNMFQDSYRRSTLY